MLLKERFEKKFRVDDSGCWIWTGFKQRDGYGVIKFGQSGRMAHRVSYQLYNNYVVQGLRVIQVCEVKSCVNPDHLVLIDNRWKKEESNGNN